jgi:hypothetical protein
MTTARSNFVVRLLIVMSVVAAGYLALLAWPEPLFKHQARRGPLVVHARHPIDPAIDGVLDEALGRLSRSPLFDGLAEIHLFLCDSPALFALFANVDASAGGFSSLLGGKIFLRPSDVAANRLLSPSSGKPVPGERTLSYFIAHEATHTLTLWHLGRWRYRRLAAWQREGYADYVAKGGPLDLGAGLRGLGDGDADWDPRRSGLYLRYHLLVTYLIDHRRQDVDTMLAGRQSEASLLEALRRVTP